LLFLGYTIYMANPELIRTLDFILNRCDEVSIDAVAEAVVRRRRELTMFGSKEKLPDPRRMAQELSEQINTGAGIEGLRQTIRDMAVRIIKQQAPELDDKQIAVLTSAWIGGAKPEASETPVPDLPPDLLFVMVSQFVKYSLGRMSESEEKRLRSEIDSWPERYWKAFPELIQLIVKDFVEGETTEDEFNNKLQNALAFKSAN
jgi:hypothetical protein